MSDYILGISAYYHDSAAALLKDGEIIAAAHEERFTRKKHDASFPTNAARYVLEEGAFNTMTCWPSLFMTSLSSNSSGCWKPITPLPRVV